MIVSGALAWTVSEDALLALLILAKRVLAITRLENYLTLFLINHSFNFAMDSLLNSSAFLRSLHSTVKSGLVVF